MTAENTRQDALTAALRCYYADEAHRNDRPHCAGVAVVAYGDIVLCAMCDAMRSAVGRTNAPRRIPGAELGELIVARTALAAAEERVAHTTGKARRAGASWTQVGDALGITRQAAQQRFGAAEQHDPIGSRPVGGGDRELPAARGATEADR